MKRTNLLERTIKSLRHIAGICDLARPALPNAARELRELADEWERLRVRRRDMHGHYATEQQVAAASAAAGVINQKAPVANGGG